MLRIRIRDPMLFWPLIRSRDNSNQVIGKNTLFFVKWLKFFCTGSKILNNLQNFVKFINTKKVRQLICPTLPLFCGCSEFIESGSGNSISSESGSGNRVLMAKFEKNTAENFLFFYQNCSLLIPIKERPRYRRSLQPSNSKEKRITTFSRVHCSGMPPSFLKLVSFR